MNRSQLPGYALALAVLVVGLAAVGVPASTLIFIPLVLACPLMMMFMMRGMNHAAAPDHGPEAGDPRSASPEPAVDRAAAVDPEQG